MFCHHCGVQVSEGHRFCVACGAAVAAAPIAAGQRLQQVLPAAPENRYERHRQTLGFLWMAMAVLRLIEAGALFLFSRFDLGAFQIPFIPRFGLSQLFFGFSSLLVLAALASFIAGYGLIERQTWARPLAIVLAILSLFKIPLGTALGVFTLWVLLPTQSEPAQQHLPHNV